MLSTNRVAELAALMGEPTRTAMLMVLADGRALTAGELAKVAGVTPQTASGHLTKLTEAGLLQVRPSGRHRYFRIPSKEVADTLEGLFRIATGPLQIGGNGPRTGPRNTEMVRARSCYDHIGGKLGVALADAMLDRGWIVFEETAGIVTETGQKALGRAGILMASAKKSHVQCRPCLDWSERREHVAGPLGKGLMVFLMDQGYVRRIGETRGLTVTRSGEVALWDLFGLRWHNLV